MFSYFESILCTLKVHFCTLKIYTFVLCKYTLYVATMLASGCIENQYSKGKEKRVSNVHLINANLLAVGDTTYAYFPFDGRCPLVWAAEFTSTGLKLLQYKRQCKILWYLFTECK